MLCAVLEMEREKAVEEERMQNELRQRKKMEKERKREELARQKEEEELRKREEEEDGVCMCTHKNASGTQITLINRNKPHHHTMCQLVSHGCLLYIVAEDPTMDRTSCILQGYLLSQLISCHCVPLFLVIAITSCCPPSLLCPPKGSLPLVMRVKEMNL